MSGWKEAAILVMAFVLFIANGILMIFKGTDMHVINTNVIVCIMLLLAKFK